jgi:hypothetical protein
VLGPLAAAVGALALVLAAWAGVQTARDRGPGRALLRGLLLLQLLLVVQAVVAVVRLLQGLDVTSTATFVGYLAVSVLLVPGGTFLALEERSRWGTGVLAVACLAVAVVVQRLVAVDASG